MSKQAEAPQDTWQAPDDVVAGLLREHGLSLVRLVTYPEPAWRGAKPMIGQVRVVDLRTGRSRVVSATAGRPGLFVSSPDARYLLQQIWGKETTAKPPELARLDLVTGKVTYLPSGWLRQFAVLYW